MAEDRSLHTGVRKRSVVIVCMTPSSLQFWVLNLYMIAGTNLRNALTAGGGTVMNPSNK